LDTDPHAHCEGRRVRRGRGARLRCRRLPHQALLVRGAARTPARAAPAARDLKLAPAQRRAWRGEEALPLTARELALLEFLLRHKGDVVSKRDILEHVWDYDFDGDPNIVEVYIRRLRNKLDRPFDRQAIETMRGAGYRLAADGG